MAERRTRAPSRRLQILGAVAFGVLLLAIMAAVFLPANHGSLPRAEATRPRTQAPS